jgi:hypothetical protein
MGRNAAAVLASIVGLVMVLTAFARPLEFLGTAVVDWFNVLAAIAFVLGGANLLKMNLLKISARDAGWGYSAVTVCVFLATIGVGLLKVGAHPDPLHPDVALSGDKEAVGGAFWWLYEYAMSPITSTLFALLAFYVASAAFRAFRAKNTAAILLLGTAFIVLLAQTAAGMFLTGWIPEDSAFAFLRLDKIKSGIIEHVQTAGMRAIMIGIALGIAAMSLRLILGIDRSYLSKN